jgi:glucose/mannose transport system permease protein
MLDAYWQKANLGLAASAATVMLAITLVIFLPLVLVTAWQQRRQEAKLT